MILYWELCCFQYAVGAGVVKYESIVTKQMFECGDIPGQSPFKVETQKSLSLSLYILETVSSQ